MLRWGTGGCGAASAESELMYLWQYRFHDATLPGTPICGTDQCGTCTAQHVHWFQHCMHQVFQLYKANFPS